MSASMVARSLFEEQPVVWEDVAEGDWISCGWSRPRLVQDRDDANLYLAEPDEDRANADGYRVMDEETFRKRGDWSRYPYLRIVWVGHSE